MLSDDLSGGLKAISGDKLKEWPGRSTRNVSLGILTGVVITMLLDSSSAVIIMTVALVNTQALTFRQASGIVLGAKIDTTFPVSSSPLAVGRLTRGRWLWSDNNRPP